MAKSGPYAQFGWPGVMQKVLAGNGFDFCLLLGAPGDDGYIKPNLRCYLLALLLPAVGYCRG